MVGFPRIQYNRPKGPVHMSMKVMKKNESRKEFGCDLDRDMVSDKVETVPDWQTINHLAYIALRRKTFCVGSSCWLKPPMPKFCVAYTNMLVSKNIKICVSPNTKHEICVTPKAKPFALGPHVGLNPQCQNFAWPIPTCWYLKT